MSAQRQGEGSRSRTQRDRRAGIPDGISLDLVIDWVRPRVSDRRFQHITGVVDVARQLAPAAPCDPFLAELAAWLHDACKELKDKELVAMAERYGLKPNRIERAYGHLLHGPVAAAVVAEELGVTNRDVLRAISQHTLGFVPMSNLSKVVYLADCLEEGRPRDYKDPIWMALDLGGKNDLDHAIVVASDLGLKHLVSAGKPIHPRTVEVRNFYLDQVRHRM